MSKELLYGATYAPLSYSEKEWEKDLSQMAAAHMRVIRVGDINAWDQIEALEGHLKHQAGAQPKAANDHNARFIHFCLPGLIQPA